MVVNERGIEPRWLGYAASFSLIMRSPISASSAKTVPGSWRITLSSQILLHRSSVTLPRLIAPRTVANAFAIGDLAVVDMRNRYSPALLFASSF